MLCLSFSFGLAFLSFVWFLLLTLPTIPCFFSSSFFVLTFTPIFLYKRIWAFMGQIILTRSRGFWAQFVFICRCHSAEELYFAADLYSTADLRQIYILSLDLSCFSLFFLVGLWALIFIELLPHGLLDMNSQKWASTIFFDENVNNKLNKVHYHIKTPNNLKNTSL